MSERVVLASLVLLTLCLIQPVSAAIDAYPFPDEAMQERYDSLIAELRCPQCLNTNLAGSDAMIAQDLRREVHRLLIEGKTDTEILDFMHERYGDFILYKPRIGAKTIALWGGPVLFLLIALVVMYRLLSARRPAVTLSASEQARIDALIAESDRK